MNNVMKTFNLSNTCKVIRVIDKWCSVFMSQDEIRRSIQMKFKDLHSYEVIKILMQVFGTMFIIHGVHIYQITSKKYTIYQIIQ